MFWNKQDFAREVCRQLVELASIRKRVEGDPELLEKVRSLEASHEGLLRKLAEAERPRRRATRKSRSAPSPAAGVARSTRRFLRSVCAELRNLQPTEESAPGTMFPPSTLTEAPATESPADSPADRCGAEGLPRLDQTCGACGKVLLSSVLGGESVSCRAGRWYHRRCLSSRDGRGRHELRN